MLTYFFLWFPMVIVAIINGAVREGVYKKSLGDLRAHQLSTVIGIILFGIYFQVIFSYWKIESSSQALRIGLMWFFLTETFEFLAGHYLFKNSWEKILNDYNIFKGRLWILIPIWVGIAPYLFYKLIL
jgi:hypothetical protein